MRIGIRLFCVVVATSTAFPAAAQKDTIPSVDEGRLSIAAVNRMIAAAVRGVQSRERSKR